MTKQLELILGIQKPGIRKILYLNRSNKFNPTSCKFKHKIDHWYERLKVRILFDGDHC